METKEKEVEKKHGIKFGSILIIAFLLLYVPSFIHWVYGRTVATGIVQIGIIEDSINVDGLLVRDEEVLKSPFAGTCIPSVGEGEKIPVNFSVATVIKKSSEKLINDLKENDLKIIKTQQVKNSNKTFFSEDLGKLEAEINEKLKLVIDAGNRNSLEDGHQIKTEIDVLFQKKGEVIGGTKTSDKYLNSLKSEKQALQNKIKQNTRDIISSDSGIISYMVDGYENILKPDAIKTFSPGFLDDVKIKEMQNNADARSVEADKPFAKVIKSVDCYIVFHLGKDKATRFKPGEPVRVRINEIGKIIEGNIDYISPEIDGNYVVSVRIDQGISETAGLRKVNFDLIKRYYEGYKVPLTSLQNFDSVSQTAKIILVKAHYASEVEVKVAGRDGEHAIITNQEDQSKKSVGLYDIYVLRPQNIKEGQYINQ